MKRRTVIQLQPIQQLQQSALRSLETRCAAVVTVVGVVGESTLPSCHERSRL